MDKTYRNCPLIDWQRLFNEFTYKVWWVVERTFGS